MSLNIKLKYIPELFPEEIQTEYNYYKDNLEDQTSVTSTTYEITNSTNT